MGDMTDAKKAELRLECLKVATAAVYSDGGSFTPLPSTSLAAAKLYADFVLGEPGEAPDVP